jgi:hypothetical protein
MGMMMTVAKESFHNGAEFITRKTMKQVFNA